MLRLVSFNMDYYWASHAPQRSTEACLLSLYVRFPIG